MAGNRGQRTWSLTPLGERACDHPAVPAHCGTCGARVWLSHGTWVNEDGTEHYAVGRAS